MIRLSRAACIPVPKNKDPFALLLTLLAEIKLDDLKTLTILVNLNIKWLKLEEVLSKTNVTRTLFHFI